MPCVCLHGHGILRQVFTADEVAALRDEIDPTIASISTLLTAASFILVLLATSSQKRAAG